MTSSGEYLDRLKNIRQKYGCSLQKPQPSYADQYLGSKRMGGYEKCNDRPSSQYLKPDMYGMEKNRLNDHITSTQTRKSIESNYRPQTSIGMHSNYGVDTSDYSKKIDREREIEMIRQNYAASRKKVIQDFSTKFYREPAVEHSNDYSKDYLRQYSKYGKDEITATKIDLINRREQSLSPIKIMSDYQQRRSYRQKQYQAPSSHDFWKQRQTKLGQLSTNKLYENNKMLGKDNNKYMDIKLQTKLSGIYGSDKVKSYEVQGLSRMDMQNKSNDYSVSNIDRIQQRIQSILGSKK